MIAPGINVQMRQVRCEGACSEGWALVLSQYSKNTAQKIQVNINFKAIGDGIRAFPTLANYRGLCHHPTGSSETFTCGPLCWTQSILSTVFDTLPTTEIIVWKQATDGFLHHNRTDSALSNRRAISHGILFFEAGSWGRLFFTIAAGIYCLCLLPQTLKILNRASVGEKCALTIRQKHSTVWRIYALRAPCG